MESLLADIRTWMSANKLKLNDDRTKGVALTGPRRSVDSSQLSPLNIGDESLNLSPSIQIIGCDLDSHMTFKSYIINFPKNCLFKLRNMYSVRRCISTDAAKVMVQTKITSKLDYCNAMLYGLPASSLSYLQSAQNTAARFISQTRKYDHIKPVMKDLHWLPIRSRIEYKILIMVYKSLHGRIPLYRRELLCRRAERGTRQDAKNNLLVPKAKRTTFGATTLTFSICRPKTVELTPK